jgi:hypothetical protein
MLTPSQISSYHRDGYVFPVPCFSLDEAADVRNHIEAFERNTGLVAGNVIRNKGHLKLTRLYELIFDARILDAVESVLGPDILCWGSSLFVKEARDSAFVAWHQDSYYWGLEPDDVCSVWIALYPSDLENGAMRVIPGSHRAATLAHKESPSGMRQHAVHARELADDVDESKAVDLLLAQGEMSLTSREDSARLAAQSLGGTQNGIRDPLRRTARAPARRSELGDAGARHGSVRLISTRTLCLRAI